MNINLKPVFFASRFVLVQMKKQNYGRIVNLGSVAMYNGGIATTPAYGALKAAVHALTKWLAGRYSSFGITVNTVALGPFKTEMLSTFPPEMLEKMMSSSFNRRFGEIDDIVQAILFVTDRSSCHITGSSLDINGGLYVR